MSSIDHIWNAVREANGLPPETPPAPEPIHELLRYIAAPLACGCGPPMCRCRDKERLEIELMERQDAALTILRMMGLQP